MEAKHTPGPWMWRRVASDGRAVAMILETEHRPVPCNDPVVFALREDWVGELSPAREADKRLIAAAPDLLAALRTALEWVEHVEAVAWDSIPEAMRGDNSAAWAIRSAIARATGGGA